jgi:hypothetical protein
MEEFYHRKLDAIRLENKINNFSNDYDVPMVISTYHQNRFFGIEKLEGKPYYKVIFNNGIEKVYPQSFLINLKLIK